MQSYELVFTRKVTAINNKTYEDNNSSIILGAIHSGTGHTALNKILACANIPNISSKLYKRYEELVGLAIEQAAKDSCNRAALQERKLVIENLQKINQLLPENIFKDIYAHFEILGSSQDNPIVFNDKLGEIINIVISYDMGWSKRGTGRSYDSLNGYGTIIGFLSGKILDYRTRNRKCNKCDIGQSSSDHICRKNFQGSAKAIEADAGADLINNSTILKEANLQVRVVIDDEDSSTIAAVRKGNSLKMQSFEK